MRTVYNIGVDAVAQHLQYIKVFTINQFQNNATGILMNKF
jgi:hypothetical protein